jgi:hypothetical protein
MLLAKSSDAAPMTPGGTTPPHEGSGLATGSAHRLVFVAAQDRQLRRVCSAFAHVGGFAAEEEVVARRREEIDHLRVFAEPCLVLRTSRNDHTTLPWPQTRCSLPRRNSILPLSIQTICSFA